MVGGKLTQNKHVRYLRLTLQYSNGWGQTNTLQVEYIQQQKTYPVGWVGGGFPQEIIPLRGFILQVETCQNFSSVENPRWS